MKNRKRKYQDEPPLDMSIYDTTILIPTARSNVFASSTVMVRRQPQPQLQQQQQQQQQFSSQLPPEVQQDNNGGNNRINNDDSDNIDIQETEKTASEKVAEDWEVMLPSLAQSCINYLGTIKDATPDPRDIEITSPYGCNCIPVDREMAISAEDEENDNEEDEKENETISIFI